MHISGDDDDDDDDNEGSGGDEGSGEDGEVDFVIRREQTQRKKQKPHRKHGHKNSKISAAKLANLKKDFPGLAEAIGGLFFQGKSRVGNNMKMMGDMAPRGKSRMTRF